MVSPHLGALMEIFSSSMGLALLVWVGGDLLKRVSYYFGNEPSLGRKSSILHSLPRGTEMVFPRGFSLEEQSLMFDPKPFY